MDYSKYVKTPKGNEYKKIFDYQKALNGIKSSAFNVSAPLGMRYFYNLQLNGDNTKKKRHLFVNAKPETQTDYTVLENCTADCLTLDSACKSCLPKNSIYYSASYSLDQIKDEISEDNPNIFKKIKKEKISVRGKKKTETRYGKEMFVAPSLEKMDAGQQFFIGSFAVIGLFLFYKAFYKR